MKITLESMQQQEHPQEPEPKREPEPERSEWEKLKVMSGEDRVWYIWTYYKMYMLAAVIVVIFLYLAATSLYNRTFDTVLHCMIINSSSESELNLSLLEEDFAQYLNLGKKQLITAETAYITYGDNASQLSFASLAKISALVSSQDLDIIIGDPATVDYFASFGGCMDLESGLSPELLALVQDRLCYAAGDDMVKRAYAIDISGTDFVSNANLGQEPPLLSIIGNSERREYTDALIRYIFAP